MRRRERDFGRGDIDSRLRKGKGNVGVRTAGDACLLKLENLHIKFQLHYKLLNRYLHTLTLTHFLTFPLGLYNTQLIKIKRWI